MLKKLIITKFKKHESLVVDFSAGLVVIRGSNEAGKSTLFHAISYALYGSRGLPDSLENTVTYGYPVTQLKVELEFIHAGVSYVITRSKSGASITGGGSTSQGQSEVTNFVTNLFQVKQDIASKITIANQGSLKAAVDGGIQAVQLIESLSGMGLIDDLIDKIQSKLPSGSTTSLEQLAAKLENEKPPVLEDAAAQEALLKATDARILDESRLEVAKQQRSALDVASANAALQEAAFIKGRRDSLLRRQEECRRVLDTPAAVITITDISQLEKAQAEQDAERVAMAAYKVYNSLQPITNTFDGTLEKFKEESSNISKSIGALSIKITDTLVLKERERGQRINDTSCALCGKLLQDVPEVVSSNSAVDARVAFIEEQLDSLALENKALLARSAEFSAIASQDSARRAKLATLIPYVVIEDTVPVSVNWSAKIPESGSQVDYKALIKQQQVKLDQILRVKTQIETAEQELAKVDAELPKLQVPDTTEASNLLAEASKLDSRIVALAKTLELSVSSEFSAKSKLLELSTQFKERLDSYKSQQEQLKELRSVIASHIKHNGLIQKLRDARPVVARQLWATVLHSVSHYFSLIRGIPSVVTKSDKGFLVGSKSYTDVSGSTIDSLGLSVRMALQKTFLPNLDFMLLDEPASGMDTVRESAMFAVLSTCGYEQVIVVTHSDVADSYAAQVVII